MNKQNNLISTEEYFKNLSRDDLTPTELSRMESFKKHIELSKKYQDLLPKSAEDVLNDYNKKIVELANKEHKNTHEEEVLENYENIFPIEERQEKEGQSRKLTKAGFINATAIIIVLLNIGFILVMAMIRK